MALSRPEACTAWRFQSRPRPAGRCRSREPARHPPPRWPLTAFAAATIGGWPCRIVRGTTWSASTLTLGLPSSLATGGRRPPRAMRAPSPPHSGTTRTSTRPLARRHARTRKRPGARTAEAPARRPVSRVLCRSLRHGDGHPSKAAGCPTAHAADPRAGQRASPPGKPGLRPPIWPCSGWSLPRFTPAPKGRHRHCGTSPRLAADGRYPPPCAGELGLSSRPPVARQTRDRPAASLARAV